MTDTKGSNEQRDGLEAGAVPPATEKTTSGTAKTSKTASSESTGTPKKATTAKKTASKATSAPKATASKTTAEKGEGVKTPAPKSTTSAAAKAKASVKKAETPTAEKTDKKPAAPKKATPKKTASTTTKAATQPDQPDQADQAKQTPSAKTAASKKGAAAKTKASVADSDGGNTPTSSATPSATSSVSDKATKKTSAATTAKARSTSAKAATATESAGKDTPKGKEAQENASVSAERPATAKKGKTPSSKAATGKTTKTAPKTPRKSTEKSADQPAPSTASSSEPSVAPATAPPTASSMARGTVTGRQEMGILESSKSLPLEGSKAKGLPAGEERKVLQGDDKAALSGSTAKALDGSAAKKLAGTSRALPAGEASGKGEEGGDAAKGTSAGQAKKAASAKKAATPKAGAKSAPKSTSRSAQKSPRTTATEVEESAESSAATQAQGRVEQSLTDKETDISSAMTAEQASVHENSDDRTEPTAPEQQVAELSEEEAARSEADQGAGKNQGQDKGQDKGQDRKASQTKNTRQARDARQARDGGQGEKGEKGEKNVGEKDTGGKGTKASAKADQKKSQPATRTQRRKMFVSVMPEEQIEVVITEEGQVQEYYVEMLQQQKTKGNIYKATIHNVDANLQAAFVNYGANKNGFLQIDEVHPEYYNVAHDEKSGRRFPPIQKVLKPGQELLVQVVKEPNASKGAFLTTYLSLAGRFLVLTPGREQIGVSRKVDDNGERERLREMLEDFKPGPGLGVIVRTVSMGMNKATLKKDLQNLKATWKKVRALGTEEVAPKLIHEEIGLATRSVRDYLTDQITEVWLDDPETATDVEELATILFPKKSKLVHVHTDFSTSLFERFNLQRQLDQIQSREVPLPSGGRLVIDTTEALTAIDINSGRSGGKSNFEDTAFRTNMEAAKMIPLQLRLRDIGGQVVCDFIEMRDKSHWREVEKTVRASMKVDRARHDVGRISSFGLLELVRQRLGSSAISVNMEVCPHCKGSGVRRNMEWQSQQALKEITRKMRAAKEQKQASVSYGADAALAMHLLNSKRQRLSHLEEQLGVTIEITLTEHE